MHQCSQIGMVRASGAGLQGFGGGRLQGGAAPEGVRRQPHPVRGHGLPIQGRLGQDPVQECTVRLPAGGLPRSAYIQGFGPVAMHSPCSMLGQGVGV